MSVTKPLAQHEYDSLTEGHETKLYIRALNETVYYRPDYSEQASLKRGYETEIYIRELDETVFLKHP